MFIINVIVPIKKIPKVLAMWIGLQNFPMRHNLDLELHLAIHNLSDLSIGQNFINSHYTEF